MPPYLPVGVAPAFARKKNPTCLEGTTAVLQKGPVRQLDGIWKEVTKVYRLAYRPASSTVGYNLSGVVLHRRGSDRSFRLFIGFLSTDRLMEDRVRDESRF